MASTRASTARNKVEPAYSSAKESKGASKRTGNTDELPKIATTTCHKAESTYASSRASTKTSKKRTANEVDERNTDSPTKSARRKRGANTMTSRSADMVDLTGEDVDIAATKKRNPPKKKASKGEERRARLFRKHPPKTYLERLARATSQRMFVVGHNVTTTDFAVEMEFDIVGSTGNLYKTTIGKVPKCDCPDSQKGHQCKHICYVLSRVLKAPAHLQYQLAFLSTELHEIYQGSSLSREQSKSKAEDEKDGKRKPVEGDCPICFMEFEPDKEEIVWCRAACGNNIHQACFNQWAITTGAQGVRCIYCRSPWQADTSNVTKESILRDGRVNDEGYVNVAAQMGLSGERDYSTYHPYWVARQRGYYYYD